MFNVKDVVDGLLAGIDASDEQRKEAQASPTEEKTASASHSELEKLASFLENAADKMEAARKEASGESLIPPDPAAVADEIQSVTGIDRSESARVQGMQSAPVVSPDAVAQQQLQQPKVASEPEEIRAALPSPTPSKDPEIRSACVKANAVLKGLLTGEWPVPFVKRLAE